MTAPYYTLENNLRLLCSITLSVLCWVFVRASFLQNPKINLDIYCWPKVVCQVNFNNRSEKWNWTNGCRHWKWFLKAPLSENIWSTCSQNFGATFCAIFVLKCALYGSKTHIIHSITSLVNSSEIYVWINIRQTNTCGLLK